MNATNQPFYGCPFSNYNSIIIMLFLTLKLKLSKLTVLNIKYWMTSNFFFY